MKKLADRECEDCKGPAGWHKPGWRRRVCVECSIKRAAVAALQMHVAEGAAYDRWKNSAGPRGRPRKNAPKE